MDLWSQLSPQWQSELAAVQSNIHQISQFLTERISSGARICPEPNLIFTALALRPTQIKVLILGQDPYPSQNLATGLAFAVPRSTEKLPPTLKNILQELKSDLNAPVTSDCDFTSWQQQGVMLLNTVLTAEEGRSLAHVGVGWEKVTTAIIDTVVRVNPEVVAVLWGKLAQQQQNKFAPNMVIAGPHPSPLSAYRGFFGSKPFSRVNQKLALTQNDEIIW